MIVLLKQNQDPPQLLLQLRTRGNEGGQGPPKEFPADLNRLSSQMIISPLNTTSILHLQMPTQKKHKLGPPIVPVSISLPQRRD